MATVLKLLIIIFFPTFIYAQHLELQFEHITVDQGLSNNTIHCMNLDSLGFYWIGTADGLNKYDGYQFTIYRNDPADSSSLSHNYIWSAYEDKYRGKKMIWVETQGGGVDMFDLETEQFTHFMQNPADENVKYTLGNVVEDTPDICWLANEYGLGKFDPKTEQVTYYMPDDHEKMPKIAGTYKSLHRGRKMFWICTMNGLYKFDCKTEQFTLYKHDPDNVSSISDNEVYGISSIRYKGQDMLWVGTANGLNLFDPDTELFTRYYHDPANPSSLSDNFIVGALQDYSGAVWVTTHGGGLNKLKPDCKQFNIYRHNPAGANSLSDNSVWSISESEHFGKDVLWIGTKKGGLNKLNRKTGKVTRYRHHPDNPNSLSNNWVFKTLETKFAGKNELWIGTYNELIKLDLTTEKFTRYGSELQTPSTQLFFGVRSLFESLTSGQELLWFGGEGLNNLNRKSGRFTQIGSTLITIIYEDKSGLLWFGGLEYGLNKLDDNTEQYTSYRHDPDDPNSISSNRITSIYESTLAGNDVLWIGTDKGLNKFDRESEQFIHYGINDGLPNETINGILEDKHGNLWLSTNYGLSKFNPKKNTFRNYDVNDGLQGNQFNEGACFQSEDGEMFFGGINGLNYFYPDSIRDNPHSPPVVITGFRIFNQQVKIKGNNQEDSDDIYAIPKSILYTDEIELSYKESVFSFEFAALDYASPEDNLYKYKMDGVDPDWVLTDASRRFATYTQLDPGEYIFQVRGSNNDGFWNNEGASIRIIITPPWWKTSWAYAGYLFLFLLSLYALRTYDKKRHHLKHQFELEHMEAEKLKEVDSMKSRFFANISHEFRTPLTLIEGPVRQMLTGEFKGNIKEQYKMILRNSGRLLRLINQLLDLSKLESGKLKLQARATDIISLTNELVQTFESLAIRKQITLNFKSDMASLVVYIDSDKYEKIINNLLSNAFKFTPDQGTIEVGIFRGKKRRALHDDVIPAITPEGGCAHWRKAGIQKGSLQQESLKKKWNPHPRQKVGRQVRDDNDSHFPIPNYAGKRISQPAVSDLVEITVTNTGPEIPADRINKIFDRFYQIDDSNTRDGEGTGIGLALTKELVELHHGTIGVQCESLEGQHPEFPPDSGGVFRTTFTVFLPLGKKHLNEDEIAETATKDSSLKKGTGGLLNTFDDTTEIEYNKQITESEISKDLPIILIVEDNPDLRKYIRNNMHNDYTIIEAANGEEGLEKAKNKIPDLIISDVMMPKMDGFEFCRKIKTDEVTSHIPVILITARAGQEDKIEGLETGADDYITKPFDNKELNIRVKNLINLRRELRERFSKSIYEMQETTLEIKNVSYTSTDKKFLQKTIDIIEKHIDDPDFTGEIFMTEIGMSISQLHRKLKALTNQSPHNFVRLIRLKRAARMLRQRTGNVTEVAYSVGFLSLSHFAKAFKEQYGQTPSEYRDQFTTNN